MDAETLEQLTLAVRETMAARELALAALERTRVALRWLQLALGEDAYRAALGASPTGPTS